MRKAKIKKIKNEKAITLIALVITIIVLLILAGVTVFTLIGENGILNKSQTARQETDEKTATEIINLKITNAQINSYSEKQQMPDLQYLANKLCEDNEIHYVELTSQLKNTASTNENFLPYINVPEKSSIFTKLKEYPYEFEIDDKLRLASIDGIKIAESDETVTIKKEEYESLKPSTVTQDSILLVGKNQSLVTGSKKLNEFTKEQENSLATYFEYEESTGKLKCKKSGWYLMDLQIIVADASNEYSQTTLGCFVNQVQIGSVGALCFMQGRDEDRNTLSIYLKEGDIVEFEKFTARSSCRTSNSASIRILKI